MKAGEAKLLHFLRKAPRFVIPADRWPNLTDGGPSPLLDLLNLRGVAKDVTSRGRWRNGTVEVALESTDEIPYAMGRVCHALEKQMGGLEMDG